MDWQVFHTRTFLKELARLPQTVRTEAEKIAFGEEIKSDVFLGGRVQKLTGYQSYYKIRIGNYRIGLRIDQEEGSIEFQRVLHRKEIYRVFP